MNVNRLFGCHKTLWLPLTLAAVSQAITDAAVSHKDFVAAADTCSLFEIADGSCGQSELDCRCMHVVITEFNIEQIIAVQWQVCVNKTVSSGPPVRSYRYGSCRVQFVLSMCGS